MPFPCVRIPCARVQLPREGRSIFLGWEPSGAALAAVQDHGGAFLWFPSKPDCVQQWEGMQFSSQVLRSAALKRNSHFDTCFASWSETRKLVLGLADGNFACWDLGSNETFISRKHFAGKHKGAITCGCWGSNGLILALGSKNQVRPALPSPPSLGLLRARAPCPYPAFHTHVPQPVPTYAKPAPDPPIRVVRAAQDLPAAPQRLVGIHGHQARAARQ